MSGLQDLPVELHAHIARAVDKGHRTDFSLVNRSWNRICMPLIWEEITLSVCHPRQVVDDDLPRFDRHLRRIKVEIGTPYTKDMNLLVRALRLVPPSVEIALEAEFSCDDFVEALEPEDFEASIKILARVADRFVSVHLDTYFQYSNIEEMVNPLAAFFAKAVECRSCFLRIDDTLNDLLLAVLQLPKLENLTLQVEDLARLDVSIPPRHALRSLGLEVVDRHNADAACALVKKYAGTLRYLSLNCCSPTDHNGFPVAFPNLKSLTVQARRGPDKLFALVDPRDCPRLRDICHPGIELARLVDQLPNFLNALGSKHRNPRIRLRIQPIEEADDVYDEYSAESEGRPDGPSVRAELRRICDERKVDVLEEGVFDVFEYPS